MRRDVAFGRPNSRRTRTLAARRQYRYRNAPQCVSKRLRAGSSGILIAMRAILRSIAVMSAVGVIATAAFLARFGLGGLHRLISTGAFGIITLLGWVVTFVAGPISAIQLFRLRNSGRVAAAVLWGSMILYYLLGIFAFREPGVRSGPIFLLCVLFAIPFGIVLTPAAKRACIANAVAKVLTS